MAWDEARRRFHVTEGGIGAMLWGTAIWEGSMGIRAPGYVGIGASRMEDRAGFGTGLLGLQLTERSAGQPSPRKGDRRQRLPVMPGAGDGARVFGWEMADGERAPVQVLAGNHTLMREESAWCYRLRAAG